MKPEEIRLRLMEKRDLISLINFEKMKNAELKRDSDSLRKTVIYLFLFGVLLGNIMAYITFLILNPNP